jgi:asparagine synthase (glutamine-hydrolysing)
MCGIAGQYLMQQSEPSNSEWVEESIKRLIRRGPDSQNIRELNNFTAVHTRLAIIDLTADANQPFGDDDNLLVFNGEIYNYKELARDFRIASLRTKSDTEVLFRLLLDEKPSQILSSLRGMFAFAYYQKKHNSLLLARDHVGQKPLFYGIHAGSLFFSSKASHVFEAVGGDISDLGLDQYQKFQLNFSGVTLYNRVFELPPGHFLVVANGKIQVTRYWNPHEGGQQEKTDFEELSFLLRQAVDRTLISDVPVAATLSGGLDSSLVAGLARQNHNLPLFHGRYAEEKDCDESQYAIRQSEFMKNVLNIVELSQDQFDRDFRNTILALDTPKAGPGAVGQFAVAREISQKYKYKVSIGGLGGDEIFCGYARYFLMDSSTYGFNILKEYSGLKEKVAITSKYSNNLERYFALISRQDQLELDNGSFRNSHAFQSFENWITKSMPDWKHMHPIKLAMIIDQLIVLPSLLHVEDGVGMFFGLEGRLPLVDVDLLEFANRLHIKLHISTGPKSLLKILAADYVHRSILDREDKMGFPVPVDRWSANGNFRESLHYFRPLGAGPLSNRKIWGNASFQVFNEFYEIKKFDFDQKT